MCIRDSVNAEESGTELNREDILIKWVPAYNINKPFPVSYPHLDVYKRQLVNAVRKKSVPRRNGKI